jgi:hypothetical protein
MYFFKAMCIQSSVSVTFYGREKITEAGKTWRDGAVAHTANYSINVLNKVFEDTD